MFMDLIKSAKARLVLIAGGLAIVTSFGTCQFTFPEETQAPEVEVPTESQEESQKEDTAKVS